MDIDPVCHMEVDQDYTNYKSVYKGKVWTFCTESCKKKFDENPEQYTSMSQPMDEDRPKM
ncbi:MAG: YHS domain-containing protein [Methanospirillum sp.]